MNDRIYPEVRDLVDRALKEDMVSRDATTEALFDERISSEGLIVAREELVASGVSVAEAVFFTVDPSVKFHRAAKDGDRLKRGDVLGRVEGDGTSLLRAERTAINFLQHLSGIATWTSRFVKAIEGTPCRILDTRKTLPGLRLLEKAAVRHGGGHNHRFHLADGVLIKDNHLALFDGSPAAAVRRAREKAPRSLKVEIEAESLEGVQLAIDAGVDILLLDNMPPALIAKAVSLVRGRAIIEVSGGIHLENVRDFALTGVDAISIGALTHSAPAVDISFDIRRV